MPKKYDFDYCIIGSGTAGGTAALMAASAGQRVCLVESDQWGGSSVNYRDIPYGASLHFSHLYHQALLGERFGLSSGNLKYNYPTAMHWRMVAANRAGAGSKKEFEQAGVICMRGLAHFVGPNELAVGKTGRVTAAKFLIATGASLAPGQITGLDTVKYLTPDTVLTTNRIPKVVAIIGAGSTGCEIAEYLANLGTKVILLEKYKQLLPTEEPEVAEVMTPYFEKRLGIKVMLEAKALALEQDQKSKKVIFAQGGQEKSLRVEAIVLATGVKPNTDLGLENAGVKYDDRGIIVEKTLQTSNRNIYAAGDVVGSIKDTVIPDSSIERIAYDAGVATANIVNHAHTPVDYRGFICMTNTYPAVASVGLTESACKAAKFKYRQAVVQIGKVMAANTTDFRVGFIKIIVDAKDSRILGATVMSPQAELVIQELSLAIKHGISIVELATTPHVAMGWADLVRIAARRLSR